MSASQPRVRGDSPAMRASIELEAAEELARDVSAAAAGYGQPYSGSGLSNIYGASYGVSHSQMVPSRSAAQRGPATLGQRRSTAYEQEEQVRITGRPQGQGQPLGEVPDFVALYEREKQRLERRKYQNRYVTEQKPFCFHTPAQSRTRRAPLPKDPSDDWRFKRARRARSASSSANANYPKPLDRLAVNVPARSTEKMVQWQQKTALQIQENREQERRAREEQENSQQVSNTMRLRVQQAVGPAESQDDKIDRIVADKKQARQRIIQQKQQDLQKIRDRVSRRPLLMEQADTLVRARRRALFRVRSALEAAGVRDVESHFQDEELDELDRVAAQNGLDSIG